MANRRFEQFTYGLVKKAVHIVGKATFHLRTVGTLAVQDLTYTSVVLDADANLISIAYTGGATAGSEVVSVVGNAISIQIETGVSTATQVKAAFDLVAGAIALATVAVSGTGGTAQVVAAAAFLAGGTDDSWAIDEAPGVASIAITGAGHFTMNLSDRYNALVDASFSLQKAIAADLIPQLVSSDVVTAKAVVFKTLTTATAARPVTGDKIYFHLILRNSSIT